MDMLKYLLRRILTFLPLMFGVIFIVFVLVRLLPGSPVHRLAGTNANAAMVEAITKKMGLDKPMGEQFLIYIKGLLRGDLGLSWNTSNPVSQDLLVRFPATLELITLSLVNCFVFGIFLGTAAAVQPKGFFCKIANVYGLVAGAIADFWVGLMFIFIFFFTFRLLPAPIGRLDLMTTPPETVTGFLLLDSLLTGNMATFKDAFLHLILPVASLTVCFTAPIMKMTRSSMSEVLQSDFVAYSRMLGLPNRTVTRYAIRNAMPPVVTMIGYTYGFLLGGAVLVETVFGWGGLGQYVTLAIANKDYAAIQGFMLVATIFSMAVYLVVDVVYMLIDPRIKF
ncbi:ABC transporter permease [Marispirochaeta sp.]|uniref:ABC transporter permease n=1 Tax=Marispirochaeta sp. TaxID=2038653 RepID=UPI0029C750EE|nr:ABC transporter permease [Marispirochaeta sp.]